MRLDELPAVGFRALNEPWPDPEPEVTRLRRLLTRSEVPMSATLTEHLAAQNDRFQRGLLQALLADCGLRDTWAVAPAPPPTRRQRLAAWLRAHRPHLHLGPCPATEEWD